MTVKNRKQPQTTRTSSKYALTGKPFPELKGQGKVVQLAIEMLEPSTTQEIAKSISRKLKTKQSPRRVVGHYITQFKKKRLVKKAA